MATPTRLERAQVQLRSRYVSRLGVRLTELEAARAVRAQDRKRGDARLRDIAHQLGGTGASFGFPQLTDVARAAELAPPHLLMRRTNTLMKHIRHIVAANA